MRLMKDIDDQAKTYHFGLFLEDLKTMDVDMEDDTTQVVLLEHMEYLQEIGRGDFQAHDQMAQTAGGRGHEYDPRVQSALAGKSKFSIAPEKPRPGADELKAGPLKGHYISKGGQIYKVLDAQPGDPIAFVKGKDGKEIQIRTRDTKGKLLFNGTKTKGGLMAWAEKPADRYQV